MKQIRPLINMVKNAGNPMAMISSLAGNNPQMKDVLDMVSRSGMDPQRFFYEACKEKNVDPDQILNMFR